jgi:hypothetical protein
MASAVHQLEGVAAEYQNAPLYPNLDLYFTRDTAHPLGRVRWSYHGRGLPQWEGGTQENLTDRWMRAWHIPETERPKLLPIERRRRHLLQVLARYTGRLGRLRTRMGQALDQTGRQIERSGRMDLEAG